MDKHDNDGFNLNPPAELDTKVFAKVAPVLQENKKIYGTKRWFQLWMPLASTAALTAFSFWFLNKKSNRADMSADDLDLQSFATMGLDEESLELVNNLELLEELEIIEAYSEDDENS